MTVTYKTGDFIVITSSNTETQLEILEASISQVRLRDIIRDIASTLMVSELDEMIVAGIAHIHQKKIETRRILQSDAMDFASYPEELKKEARDRFIFVTGILDLDLPSHSEQRITPHIQSLFEENTNNKNNFEHIEKNPSARTVQRWIVLYVEGNESIRALIPRRAEKGNRKPKVEPIIEPYIKLAIAHFKKPENPSIAIAYGELKTLIDFDNKKITDPHKKMKVPTKTAFIKRLTKEAPKELMIARKGKEATRRTFKTAKLPQEISLILQRVEIDHTQLDLFVVDEKANLILGRPYVTAILDYKSKCVLGFYIGFEFPSYLSIAKALRHAILPKTYVKERYPNVVNSYDCYGLPKVLVVDRGKDFESIALKDACLDLNIRIQRNPAKHPWYKGSIESFFKSKNNELLNDKSGKAFPNIVDTNAYKPEKHAIITMGLFMEIFHIWLIDCYHQDKVSRGTIIPSDSWKKDLDKVPLRPMNKDALDIVLSETDKKKNDKGGVTYNYIQYDNDELYKLRAEIGFKKVWFKYDREDLGQIRVLDERNPQKKIYFTVPALKQSYARDLSLHQHKTILAFNKKYLDGKTDPEALATAKMMINELIKENLASRKSGKISTTQKISRYKNIGQQKDNSVTGTVVDDSDNNISEGVPKPDIQKDKSSKIEKISGYDGESNTLPDELDF
jgi:putative transposase